MIRLAVLLTMLLFPDAASACGPDGDCTIGARSYRIRMPDGHDGTSLVGAIVYAHGYKGTAQGVMANTALARMASELGIALIAAQAAGNDWVIPNAPRKRQASGEEEFDYFAALADDAAARFAIDRSRMMMSGFSAGGMMVWTLACHRAGLFAAYAPIAGTFWAPVPEDCPGGPVTLIHMHGLTDKVVPLQGRPIADTRQADVNAAFAMLRRRNGLDMAQTLTDGDLTCTTYKGDNPEFIALCLHPGGHAMKPDWLARAWRAFEAAGAL